MVIRMNRVILHADLNNFYASVECLFNPEIRDKPVAVCGSQSTRHGIVLAKNYIAKKYGVKTGEATWEAKNKCPQLVIVRPNYMLYLRYSILAREIYENYTNQIEAFGIDECWVDVTESTKLFGSGEKIANEIKDRIKEELGVTASIGVSFNKIFAKLASDMRKPDAVTVITQDDFKEKIWKLPVNELLYVGPSSTKKFLNVGICTIGDLANAPIRFVEKLLGKWGATLWMFANGYDDAPVVKSDYQSIIKGIGNSLTTPRDLVNNDDAKILFYVLAESVGERLRRHHMKGQTIQISIRDSELKYIERQAQLPRFTFITPEIARKAYDIFVKNWTWDKNIRALGIRATDLVTADSYIQLSLLIDESQRIKKELLDCSIDSIRQRFGHYSVQRALLLSDKKLNANPVEGNIIHPVSYFNNTK